MRILRGSELSILVCKLHLQVRLTNKKSLLQWQNGEKRPALNSFNERARKTTLNLLRRVEGKHMRNLFTVTYCLQYRLAIRSERLLNWDELHVNAISRHPMQILSAACKKNNSYTKKNHYLFYRCWSNGIGRSGNSKQQINLANGCWGHGTILHEIGILHHSVKTRIFIRAFCESHWQSYKWLHAWK